MKILRFFSILLCFFTLSIPLVHAEKIVLGIFSAQQLNEFLAEDKTVSVSNTDFPLPAEEIRNWLSREEQLTYSRNYRSEIENSNFCSYKKSIVCALVFPVRNREHIQKISQVKMDTEATDKYLDDLSRQANRDPVNATLQITDGKVSVFSLSSDGITLDKNKSIQILNDFLKNMKSAGPIALAYSETKPEISTDSISNLGITGLIGEGTSNFAGSPKNRIYNINVAIKRFNGTLIKPGEEFSFVKTLGEVDKEHGYLPELVIKGDKTEPDYGGGICQVSTTAFRAALNSGLKITARTNHAYPVSYYNPQGMDATVYVPRPDLKFINNTPSYILIQTKIEGTVLTFYFYGTSDGRKTELIGPTIIERNPDGSMKTTLTQQVTDKDGQVIINDIFKSNYDSPSKYPHPGELLTEKPKDWSKKQWEQYKKEHNL